VVVMGTGEGVGLKYVVILIKNSISFVMLSL